MNTVSERIKGLKHQYQGMLDHILGDCKSNKERLEVLFARNTHEPVSYKNEIMNYPLIRHYIDNIAEDQEIFSIDIYNYYIEYQNDEYSTMPQDFSIEQLEIEILKLNLSSFYWYR